MGRRTRSARLKVCAKRWNAFRQEREKKGGRGFKLKHQWFMSQCLRQRSVKAKR